MILICVSSSHLTLTRANTLTGDNADVLIFLHDDAEQSIQDVIQSIIQRRYASPESVSLGEDHATLTIRKAALNAIAGMDSVKAIESVREPVLHNSEAGVILGSGSAVVQNVKVTYTGKGQIVAVADGGLDRGRTDATSIHDAFRGLPNTSFATVHTV